MYFVLNEDETQPLEIVHSSMLKEEIPSNFVYFHQTIQKMNMNIKMTMKQYNKRRRKAQGNIFTTSRPKQNANELNFAICEKIKNNWLNRKQIKFDSFMSDRGQ